MRTFTASGRVSARGRRSGPGDKGCGGDGPCPRGGRGCRAELRAKRSVRPAARADGPMGRVRDRPRGRRDAAREVRHAPVEEVAPFASSLGRWGAAATTPFRPGKRECRRHHPHHLGARHVDVDDQTHSARRRPVVLVELGGWQPWSPPLLRGSCPRFDGAGPPQPPGRRRARASGAARGRIWWRRRRPKIARRKCLHRAAHSGRVGLASELN